MRERLSQLVRTMPRWVRELKSVGLAIGFVLIVRTVAAEPFVIPSPSMVPTLLVGDALIANKHAYGYGKFSSPIGLMPDFAGRVLGALPERGDVVVFRLPRDPATSYVKRLIGLPGDRIQMRHGGLYINGRAVSRRPIGVYSTDWDGRTWFFTRYLETLPNGREHEILKLADGQPLDDTREFIVPPRSFFMMGDNRDMSLDSRVPSEAGGVGFVPEENLIGRAALVLFSRDPAVSWWDIPQWPHAFRRSRFFAAVE
jgi:signal peptidase I